MGDWIGNEFELPSQISGVKISNKQRKKILKINQIKKLWFSRDTSPYHWNHHGDQWGGIINDQYVQIHVDDCIALERLSRSCLYGFEQTLSWLLIDVPINGQRVLYWVMPLASSSMHSLGFEPTSVEINAGSTERALASAAILASHSKTLSCTNIYKR